jgi:hypothetical protein
MDRGAFAYRVGSTRCSVEPANTAGLGWPLTRRAPQRSGSRAWPSGNTEVAGD